MFNYPFIFKYCKSDIFLFKIYFNNISLFLLLSNSFFRDNNKLFLKSIYLNKKVLLKSEKNNNNFLYGLKKIYFSVKRYKKYKYIKNIRFLQYWKFIQYLGKFKINQNTAFKNYLNNFQNIQSNKKILGLNCIFWLIKIFIFWLILCLNTY